MYIDDLLVFSPTLAAHFTLVFERLKDVRLKLNLSKHKEVEYLDSNQKICWLLQLQNATKECTKS